MKTAAGESIPEQRRRQIFEAASEVFGRKGYASASVRDIADAAGMPVPTMYQYCRSKEDILSMVFDTYMRELGGSVQAAGSVQGTPAKRMKNAVSASLSMHDKYRHQIKLMFQETGSLGPQNRARVLQTTRSANEIWAELIREGNKTGDFNVGSPALVANFIPIVAASWVLRRWNMDGATLAEMHDALEQFVMHGLSGPPRSGAQRQTTKRAAKKFVRAKRADAR
ncbi:MAG: TetR/AcrR family transcriptional regulator [Casimicrobiaceae bacterium]